MAASWYRKAADHLPDDLGGVWEAEVQLAHPDEFFNLVLKESEPEGRG